MKGKYLFVFACIILSLASCSKKIISSTQKIDPSNPDLSPTNFRMDSLPYSEINIPIQVNLKPVYDMAENSVDTVFTSPKYPDEWVQDGCDTRYKYVFRRSPLQMQAIGTSLNLGFTGYYKIIGSTRICINGTVVSPWTPACRCGFGNEGERRVNVSFSNSLSIQPNYKVNLSIVRNEPEPLDKCEVCFWGQDITKQILNGLKEELDVSKKELEKSYGSVDLKPVFQHVWDSLNKVYNLFGLGWLKINPQNLRINNLYALNDSLNIFLGLTARPAISFEQPAEETSIIPNLGTFSRKQGFNIYLDAVLNYDSLSAILNQQLAGKTFDFKKFVIKKKFIIDSCSIYGAGNENLVIKVNFSGTNNGIVYLLCKAFYNIEKRRIEVADVDFDIKSKNILLGSADWLFDKQITREITKQARFELGAYIDSAKISINQQLNQEWIPGIRSYGTINDISLIGIYPMRQHLVIRSNCNGDMSVKVDSINFSL